MRSRTAGENTTLAARHSKKYLKVEIKDAVGAWIDYSAHINLDRQDQAEVWQTNNQRIAQFNLQLAREAHAGGTLVSLSPLIDSDIALGREVRISGARVAMNATPVAGDYKQILLGRVDTWQIEQDPMVLSGRDRSGLLMDRKIEEEATFGTVYGEPVEDTIQAILDAWASGLFTLVLDAASPLNATPFPIYEQVFAEGTSVFDAIQQLAAQAGGHVIEYRWSDAAGAFQLLLYLPDRATSTVLWTFGPLDYYEVSKLDADLLTIRNAWVLDFLDSATGLRDQVTYTDGASETAHGRMWAKITEADDSPIDTTPKAQAMIDAAGIDTSWPDAELEIETDGFWPVQLCDYYRHSANVVHFNADQDYAVSGWRHTWAGGNWFTKITTRGQPAGRPASWRRLAQRTPTFGEDIRIDATPVLDEDTGGVWSLIPNRTPDALAIYYTFTSDGSTPADPKGASELGGPVGTLSTLNAIALITTAVDNKRLEVKVVAVENADGTGEVGPIRFVGATTHQFDNRPVVSWLPYQPATLTQEGVRFIARDDGSTVDFGYAVVNVGAAAPVWPGDFTRTGLVADPVTVDVAVAKPAEGATEKLIYYQAADADGNFAYEKPQIVRIDDNAAPSGWIDTLDASPSVTPKLIVNSDDSDTGSWRFRVTKVTSESDDNFVNPSFAVHADEFAGNAFGAVTVLGATHQITEGQRLNIAAYFFRTTSTVAATQQASMRSPVVKFVVRIGASRIPAIVIESESEVEDAVVTPVATQDTTTMRSAPVCLGFWSDVRDGVGTDGTGLGEPEKDAWRNSTVIAAGIKFCTDVNKLGNIKRALLVFPSVEGDTTSIVLWCTALITSLAGQSVVLVDATPGDPALVNPFGDYQLIGETIYSAAQPLSGLADNTFVTFPLNAAAMAALAEAARTNQPFAVGIRIEADRADASPTWASNQQAYIEFSSAQAAIPARQPMLSATNVHAGRVILRHTDPAAIATQIQYRTRTAPHDWPAAWTALVAAPVPVGILSSNPLYTLGLTERASWIQAREVYVLGGVTFYSSPITSSAFDSGKRPDLACDMIALDKRWNVSAWVQGDHDTRSIRAVFDFGVAPPVVQRSEVQVAPARNGRNITAQHMAALYAGGPYSYYSVDLGLPISLLPGEKAVAGILGYAEEDGAGLESTELYLIEIARPREDEAGVPEILTASLFVERIGADIQFTVEWTTANVTDDFLMVVMISSPSLPGFSEGDSEVDPLTNENMVVTVAPDPSGGIESAWVADLILYDPTNPVDTLAAYGLL